MTANLLPAALLFVCCAPLIAFQETPVSEAAKLQRMAARFAPTDITADVSQLSPADRQVLAKLVEASKIIDGLFLRQVLAGHQAILFELGRDPTPGRRARLLRFRLDQRPR